MTPAEKERAYRSTRREQYAAFQRAYYARNREKVLAYDKMRKKRDREKFAARYREKTYGLSPAAFDDMLRAQSGRCAICTVAFEREGRSTVVDHCHSTGVVRGLLCQTCNRGMGLLKENPDTLRACADYLDHHARAA